MLQMLKAVIATCLWIPVLATRVATFESAMRFHNATKRLAAAPSRSSKHLAFLSNHLQAAAPAPPAAPSAAGPGAADMTFSGCHPKCHWGCSQGCDQVCQPVCAPPQCETVCGKAENCLWVCDEPRCAVVCPGSCANGDCPDCTTLCGPPNCYNKCAEDCVNRCKDPECSWKCTPGPGCTQPACALDCAPPRQCPLRGSLQARPSAAVPLGKYVVARGLASLNPAPLIGELPPPAPMPAPAPSAPLPGPAPEPAPAPATTPEPTTTVPEVTEAPLPTVQPTTVAPPEPQAEADAAGSTAKRLDIRGAASGHAWAGKSEQTVPTLGGWDSTNDKPEGSER